MVRRLTDRDGGFAARSHCAQQPELEQHEPGDVEPGGGGVEETPARENQRRGAEQAAGYDNSSR
jgi:hypothetical protein